MSSSESLIVTPDWDILLSQWQHDSKSDLNNLVVQCHLVFSLLLFLGLSVRDFLFFLFESNIPSVKQKAGLFLANRASSMTPFGPARVYEAWHNRFPRSRPHLHSFLVQPCAEEIVLAESDRVINDPELKITPKACTMATIRESLNPGKLATKYQTLIPFTWSLLSVFTTSPNRWRKAKAKKRDTLRAEVNSIGDEWIEDDEGGDSFDAMFAGETGVDWKARGFVRNATFTLVFAISMMAFTRNTATNLLPMVLGLFMEIGGTSARVISTLSNAGASVSVSTIERLKAILSDDAKQFAIELMQSSGVWYTIFDNINIYLRKFQQRLFNKNSMIHATNAVAISIPDADISACNLDAKLLKRGQRSQATGADILPTAEDEEKILGSFRGLVIHFILGYCPGSDSWSDRAVMKNCADELMASDRPLPVKKTDARPLGVFDVNEGSKIGMVNMMKSLQEISGLTEDEWSGEVRIIAGDWLTASLIRSAIRERADDINSMERMEYAEDISQLFHFALNATHKLMRLHFGNSLTDPGSLAKHKGLLNRTWDAMKPNYADGKALIRHSLIARILYTVMLEQDISRWADLAKWTPTVDEVKEFADTFVAEYVDPKRAEEAKRIKDDWLAHSIYFIRDALLFCEFEHAVSHADAGRVLRVFKYWVLSFRGAGLHNYARECIELLLRWKYELTDSLRDALEHSWFVNRWGLPGRWIAADLYLEQLNYWVKRVFIAKGAGVTLKYIIEKGSACVEAFREISHLFARTFGFADRARRHKEVNVVQDLRLLAEDMMHNKLHIATPDRPVNAQGKVSKKDGQTTPQSAIVDCLDKGAELLQSGKFDEFVRTTTFDPAVGYPVDSSHTTASHDVLLNGTAFDITNTNPIEFDAEEDMDDGDDHVTRCPGLGSLGGGME